MRTPAASLFFAGSAARGAGAGATATPIRVLMSIPAAFMASMMYCPGLGLAAAAVSTACTAGLPNIAFMSSGIMVLALSSEPMSVRRAAGSLRMAIS